MDLSRETKGFLKGILILSALGLVIGFFLVPSTTVQTSLFQITSIEIPIFRFPSNVNYAIGVFLGALMSAIKCLLLERAVNKAIKMESKQKAQIYMNVGYLPRFLITGSALFASVFFLGFFGILGAFVGTMSLTISAYIVGLSESRAKKASAKTADEVLSAPPQSTRKESDNV